MKREKKEVKNKENRNMKTPRKDEKRRLHLRGAKSKRIKETRKWERTIWTKEYRKGKTWKAPKKRWKEEHYTKMRQKQKIERSERENTTMIEKKT